MFILIITRKTKTNCSSIYGIINSYILALFIYWLYFVNDKGCTKAGPANVLPTSTN